MVWLVRGIGKMKNNCFSCIDFLFIYIHPILKKETLSKSLIHTVCFRALAKLNLLMVVRFKLEPIFDTAPAVSKNEAQVKRCQN